MSNSAPEASSSEHPEYRALRDTIRERGSLRLVLFVATLSIWAALIVATSAVLTLPVTVLIPLLVLAAGFEAIAALHIGVERIGRYVQVRFEADYADGTTPLRTWERTSMAWGRRFPGTGTDPLFTTIFLLATVLNMASAVLASVPAELAVLAAAHALFVWRLLRVRAWAGRQRAEDLQRYRELLSASIP